MLLRVVEIVLMGACALIAAQMNAKLSALEVKIMRLLQQYVTAEQCGEHREMLEKLIIAGRKERGRASSA